MSAQIKEPPSCDQIKDVAVKTFRETFDVEPEFVCCAPGRVNLMGEHVDYNDGFVLPMALPFVTVIAGGHRPGVEVEAEAEADVVTCCPDVDEPKRIKFNLKHLQSGTPKWANYIKGVLHYFRRDVKGFRAVIASTVPMGAGLSSSAALEVATLTFLEHFSGFHLDSDVKRALICQAAEHKFAGTPCGIMDQMVSLVGRKDHVLLLDCRSLETLQIPFRVDEEHLVLLICNSNVRHELSNGEYSKRREDCLEALKRMGLTSYRDAVEADLSVLDECTRPLAKRARHVVTEMKRTQEAEVALRQRNFVKMGALMIDSHNSLRDDFEVSCPELDVLVDAAIKCPGVLGSRMTGGGFGGCTITLVRREAVDNAMGVMRTQFRALFNSIVDFYVATPGTGAQRLHL